LLKNALTFSCVTSVAPVSTKDGTGEEESCAQFAVSDAGL
jgi:hypothetical protein